MIHRPSFIVFFLVIGSCRPASFRSVAPAQPAVSDEDATAERRAPVADDQASISDEPIVATEVIAAESNVLVPEQPQAPPATTPTLEIVKAACATALKNGAIKTKVQPIFFVASTETCEFERNDNLSRVNQVIRARREEAVDLSLDEMSRLCNIKFDAPKQNMKFDDEILLTLNQIVIASSQDYSVKALDLDNNLVYPNGLMVDSDGLVAYKWLAPNGLRDQKYYKSKLTKYCIGMDPKAANFDRLCQIPKTDTNGFMKLSVPQDFFLKLTAKAGLLFDKDIKTPPIARLGFITTGDDNDSDCQHFDFRMSVTIQYIPQ